jgi:hypothetical protein
MDGVNAKAMTNAYLQREELGVRTSFLVAI